MRSPDFANALFSSQSAPSVYGKSPSQQRQAYPLRPVRAQSPPFSTSKHGREEILSADLGEDNHVKDHVSSRRRSKTKRNVIAAAETDATEADTHAAALAAASAAPQPEDQKARLPRRKTLPGPEQTLSPSQEALQA